MLVVILDRRWYNDFSPLAKLLLQPKWRIFAVHFAQEFGFNRVVLNIVAEPIPQPYALG